MVIWQREVAEEQLIIYTDLVMAVLSLCTAFSLHPDYLICILKFLLAPSIVFIS